MITSFLFLFLMLTNRGAVRVHAHPGERDLNIQISAGCPLWMAPNQSAIGIDITCIYGHN